MVSLKYETDYPGQCISTTSGVNLCHTLQNLKIGVYSDIIIIILAIIFRRKMVKDEVYFFLYKV